MHLLLVGEDAELLPPACAAARRITHGILLRCLRSCARGLPGCGELRRILLHILKLSCVLRVAAPSSVCCGVCVLICRPRSRGNPIHGGVHSDHNEEDNKRARERVAQHCGTSLHRVTDVVTQERRIHTSLAELVFLTRVPAGLSCSRSQS